MPEHEEPAFVPVKEPERIAELANFAEGIFREHFASILTPEELDYLCNHLLGIGTLIRAIADEGYEYYFVDVQGSHIGFVGIQKREECLWLSKLYLAKEWRGKGYGRAEFEFVKQRARALGCGKIQLTCARDNRSSLAAYHHLGCDIVQELDTELEDGIVMHDYLIEYTL